MNAVLGVDTSCYMTSLALVDEPGERVLASGRMLLRVGEGQRGLQQSVGVFEHVRQLPELSKVLFEKVPDARIVAVCASTRPRSTQADSYMPVFCVGESMARVLAATQRVPFYVTSHQDGHIRAAIFESDLDAQADFLALHLSGGTTEMLESRAGRLTLVGGSSDLHAGQLVDRIGVQLGLPFPCGPALEALAVRGHALHVTGVSMKGCFCQLSGAQTKLSRLIDAATHAPEDIAAEVYDLLCRSIARMLEAGAERTGLERALLAGGVSSSAYLRRLLVQRLQKRHSRLRITFGKPELSGDNAVGVALLGAQQHRAALSSSQERMV